MQKIAACFALLFSSVFLFPCDSLAGKQRVLVVPGIMASMSKDLFCGNETAIKHFENWASHAIEPRYSIPDAWTIDPIRHTYDDMMLYIDKRGFLAIPVPYDWRNDLHYTASTTLRDAILKWAEPGKPVDIVAHSTGGIVVRDYIQTYGGDNINKVAFIGVPHRGSVKSYATWEGSVIAEYNLIDRFGVSRLVSSMRHGCKCGAHNVNLIRGYCKDVSASEIISLLQLEPVFPFLRLKDGYLVPQSSMCQPNTYLAELNNNAYLLTDSDIQFKNFSGENIPTLLDLALKDKRTKWDKKAKKRAKKCSKGKAKFRDGKIKNIQFINGDGDGTVLSASSCPRLYIRAFKQIPCLMKANAPHGNLPTIFKREIVKFLKEPSNTTSSSTSTSSSTTTPTTTHPTTTDTTLPGGDNACAVYDPIKDPKLIRIKPEIVCQSGLTGMRLSAIQSFTIPESVTINSFKIMLQKSNPMIAPRIPAGRQIEFRLAKIISGDHPTIGSYMASGYAPSSDLPESQSGKYVELRMDRAVTLAKNMEYAFVSVQPEEGCFDWVVSLVFSADYGGGYSGGKFFYLDGYGSYTYSSFMSAGFAVGSGSCMPNY